MFGRTAPTAYDLRFVLFGIPVRVHPIFWLSAAIIGWSSTPGRVDFVLVCILCIFVSVLVHELGHAVVTRAYGWPSEIVLEFFGGYATGIRHSTWKDITVLICGPAAGFSLFALVLLFEGGRRSFGWFAGNVYVDVAVDFLLFVNLAWNVFNLLPVFPLDGGQIADRFLSWLRPRDGDVAALFISMITAGAMAAWSFYARSQNRGVFGLDPLFLGIMFAYLAFQSYQLFEHRKRGYW